MDFYIDETVYTGSPEDMSGRLPREVRTYALLDTLGIPFTRVDHDATATIDACLEVAKILGIHMSIMRLSRWIFPGKTDHPFS